MGLRFFELPPEEGLEQITQPLPSSSAAESIMPAASTAWLIFWLFVGFVLFVLIPFALAHKLSKSSEPCDTENEGDH